MPTTANTFPGDYPSEIWTITLVFTAPNETSARYTGFDVTRRLANVLPGYDKNHVALTREADPAHMIPLYCADDIYCHRDPDHTGPCRNQHGHNLDTVGSPAIDGGETE